MQLRHGTNGSILQGDIKRKMHVTARLDACPGCNGAEHPCGYYARKGGQVGDMNGGHHPTPMVNA